MQLIPWSIWPSSPQTATTPPCHIMPLLIILDCRILKPAQVRWLFSWSNTTSRFSNAAQWPDLSLLTTHSNRPIKKQTIGWLTDVAENLVANQNPLPDLDSPPLYSSLSAVFCSPPSLHYTFSKIPPPRISSPALPLLYPFPSFLHKLPIHRCHPHLPKSINPAAIIKLVFGALNP
jgi:hypothetical protein